MTALSLEALDLRLTDRAVVLWFTTHEQARAILLSSYRTLAEWARKLGKHETQLHYPNAAKRCYRILASMADSPEPAGEITPALVPGVTLAQMMSLPMMRVLTEFLEFPDERRALVRLYDQRQIAMTKACQALIKNATVDEAIGRKRESYWHPADLDEFLIRSQRELEPNNPQSSIIVSWRGVDRTGTDWREFTHSYRLVQDADGILYHCSKNLEFRSIASPVLT